MIQNEPLGTKQREAIAAFLITTLCTPAAGEHFSAFYERLLTYEDESWATESGDLDDEYLIDLGDAMEVEFRFSRDAEDLAELRTKPDMEDLFDAHRAIRRALVTCRNLVQAALSLESLRGSGQDDRVEALFDEWQACHQSMLRELFARCVLGSHGEAEALRALD